MLVTLILTFAQVLIVGSLGYSVFRLSRIVRRQKAELRREVFRSVRRHRTHWAEVEYLDAMLEYREQQIREQAALESIRMELDFNHIATVMAAIPSPDDSMSFS